MAEVCKCVNNFRILMKNYRIHLTSNILSIEYKFPKILVYTCSHHIFAMRYTERSMAVKLNDRYTVSQDGVTRRTVRNQRPKVTRNGQSYTIVNLEEEYLNNAYQTLQAIQVQA